jgi:hypothetical protein
MLDNSLDYSYRLVMATLDSIPLSFKIARLLRLAAQYHIEAM